MRLRVDDAGGGEKNRRSTPGALLHMACCMMRQIRQPAGMYIGDLAPPSSERVSHMPQVSRCGAKTRAGTPCQCPPVPGRTRCRLHGGLSPGAPRGSRNGNYTNGEWTAEAIEERRWLRSLVRAYAGHSA